MLATLLFLPIPKAQAQHCVTVECFTSDCYWVGPGQRRCRRICKRRCWHPPPPRYEPRVYEQAPEPRYDPLRYAAPAQTYQTSQRPARATPPAPELLILILGGIGILILLGVAAATQERVAVDQVHSATDATRNATENADALAVVATTTADEIDRYIAQEMARAYERGRHSPAETRDE